ncbi:MAG: Ig-like domain-containing protein [Sphingobacteriales bacterium]|nr:Ig-like domain-containing protein [Sphingobacteriales bacterium]MBI3719908.1 Ig-like domain-containing protein [Sphingobacteriales bacterium]
MKRFNLHLLTIVLITLLFAGCKKDTLNPTTTQTEIAMRKGGGTGGSTVPVVSFTSPTNGSTVTGTITVQVSASSPVGIKNTSLMITVGTSNCLFGNDATSPYTYTWDTNSSCLTTIKAGTQVKLRATATDNNGTTNYTDITVTKQ